MLWRVRHQPSTSDCASIQRARPCSWPSCLSGSKSHGVTRRRRSLSLVASLRRFARGLANNSRETAICRLESCHLDTIALSESSRLGDGSAGDHFFVLSLLGRLRIIPYPVGVHSFTTLERPRVMTDLFEHVAESGGAFVGWFAGSLGLSVAWVTLVVVIAAVAASLIRALRHDQLEIRRRGELIDAVRTSLRTALGVNENVLAIIEEQRLTAQARFWVEGQPVERLVEVPGIGHKSVATLRARGYRTLGEIAKHGITDVYRVGRVRQEAITHYLASLEAGALQLLNGPSTPMVRAMRSAGLDRHFDEFRAEILARQTTLGASIQELLEFNAHVALFAAEARGRTRADRVKVWMSEGVDFLRHPSKGLTLAGVASLFGGVLFALPHLALAWDPGLASDLGVIGFALAWFGLHAVVVAHYLVPAHVGYYGARPPSPSRFHEQNIQFDTMRMAHEAGVAPPEVFIVPADVFNAFAIGGPSGPSAVFLYTGLIEALTPKSLSAVIGHELGHLAGDHSRIGTTIARVLSPFTALSRFTMTAASWVWFRGTHRTLTYRGRVRWAPHFGIRTLLHGALGVPLALLSISLTALRLSFRVLSMAVSRQAEYLADAAGARLSGDPSHMARALQRIAAVERKASAEHGDGPGVLQDLFEIARMPDRPWSDFVDRVHDAMGSTHPSTHSRLAALHHGSVAIGDMLIAGVQSVAVVACAATVLWYSVRSARAAESWGRDLAGQLVEWAAPAQAPISQPVVEPSPAVVTPAPPVFPKQGCHLRTAPAGTSKPVLRFRRGVTCTQTGPSPSGWIPVRCGENTGFVHDTCVGKPPRAPGQP